MGVFRVLDYESVSLKFEPYQVTFENTKQTGSIWRSSTRMKACTGEYGLDKLFGIKTCERT